MLHKVIIQFRNTFAELFPNETTQRRVVAGAGIVPSNIYFSQPAFDVWQSILQEAEKQNKMDDLLHYSTREEYSTSRDLVFCKLLWIVYQVEWEMEPLRRFYEYSITNYTIVRKDLDKFKDIVDVLQELWQCNEEVSTRVTPLVEFVCYLNQYKANEPVAPVLQLWIEDALAKLNKEVNQDRITRIYKPYSKSNHSAEPSSLVIVIEPSKNGRRQSAKKTYLVEVYIYREEYKLEYKTAKPLAMDKIQLEIDKIRRKIITENPSITSLWTEYFLPIDLLLIDNNEWQWPDHWLIPDDPLGSTYGKDDCIVYRSLDRVKAPQLYRMTWNTKWSKFTQSVPSNLYHHFKWLDEQHNNYLPQDLRDELEHSELCTCVGLSLLPSDPKTRFGIFYALLKAGIPIILWSRLSKPLVAAHLETLISTDLHWRNLPAHLQKLRSNSDKDVKQLMNHLILLWDDPTRIPNKSLLINPEQ